LFAALGITLSNDGFLSVETFNRAAAVHVAAAADAAAPSLSTADGSRGEEGRWFTVDDDPSGPRDRPCGRSQHVLRRGDRLWTISFRVALAPDHDRPSTRGDDSTSKPLAEHAMRPTEGTTTPTVTATSPASRGRLPRADSSWVTWRFVGGNIDNAAALVVDALKACSRDRFRDTGRPAHGDADGADFNADVGGVRRVGGWQLVARLGAQVVLGFKRGCFVRGSIFAQEEDPATDCSSGRFGDTVGPTNGTASGAALIHAAGAGGAAGGGVHRVGERRLVARPGAHVMVGLNRGCAVHGSTPRQLEAHMVKCCPDLLAAVRSSFTSTEHSVSNNNNKT
jgi:hypothetical protein